ncbi:MAG TPA: FtsX-like permease family protein [bacterium]|nr:FtsX-like permease family protein [bacterium]
MIKFLFKGVIRDSHRSRFPIIIVIIGVLLTVLGSCWLKGVMGDMVDFNARYYTGHVKVVTRAFAENLDQMPLDLALVDIASLKQELSGLAPDMQWISRIRFGGLLDVPDAKGETRAQGPVMGLAVDFSPESGEVSRLNIAKSLVAGRLPLNQDEALISHELAGKMALEPGDVVTLIGSTMYGGLTMTNYRFAGTVRFGIHAMDRGAVIVRLEDARMALDMDDAATAILGYFGGGRYSETRAQNLSDRFNASLAGEKDEFSPQMMPLSRQDGLHEWIEYAGSMSGMLVTLFVLVMSLVLWNAGLLGGLRRYGEVGVRLAIGEHKGHIYRSMIGESVLIGLMGSLLGTLAGLAAAWPLERYGIDMGFAMQNTTMMIPTVFRARITPEAYYIGFFPGLFSTVLGTSLSGIGIYKRQTAQLFKELET